MMDLIGWILTSLERLRHSAPWKGFISTVISTLTVRTVIWALSAAAPVAAIAPPIVVSSYSMANGLPFFEVMSALGNNLLLLTFLSFLFTLGITILLLFPGFVKLSDPCNLPAEIVELTASERERHDRIRWAWAFVPGGTLAAILVFISAFDADDAQMKIERIILSITLVSLFATSAVRDIRWTSPALTKITNADLREKIKKKYFKLLLFLNLLGLVYFSIYVEYSFKFLERYIDRVELLAPPLSRYIFIVTAGAVGAALYNAATAWGNRLSVSRILGVMSGGMIFLTILFPNANHLLQRYMFAWGQGGDRLVVMITDPTTPYEWPELFDSLTNDIDAHGAGSRTRVLPLALLGTTKIFVRVPQQHDPSQSLSEGDPVMIDRSRVRDIAFPRIKSPSVTTEGQIP